MVALFFAWVLISLKTEAFTGTCSDSDESWCFNGVSHDCNDAHVQQSCCNYCSGSMAPPPTPPSFCSGLIDSIISSPVGSPSQFTTLIWQDEFEGSSLDSSIWGYDSEDAASANEQLQAYTPANVEVSGGTLKLKAKRENYQTANHAYTYTSGSIVTRSRRSLWYGRIDVRAKMPTGKGVWPAIWLLGNNIDTAPWPLCGEIDIMEFVGYAPDELHFSLHTQAANFKSGGQATAKVNTEMSNEWHVYSTTWTPNSITGEVDGVEYFVRTRAETGNSENEWPFDQSFFMILNLAVGGNWGGQCGVDEAAFQGEGQVMEVDWVRVYCSVDEDWCSNGGSHDCNDASVQAHCCNYCAGGAATPRPPSDTGSCSGSDEGWCSNGDNHDCNDAFVQRSCCNYCARGVATPRPPNYTGSCSSPDEGWCFNGDNHDCNDAFVQRSCCNYCARGDATPRPPTDTGSCSGSDEAWCSNGDSHNCNDAYVQQHCCNYCVASSNDGKTRTGELVSGSVSVGLPNLFLLTAGANYLRASF